MCPKKFLLMVCAAVTAMVLAGCGSSSSSSSSNKPPVSGLKKRVLLSNSEPALATNSSPGLSLLDAQKDLFAKGLSSAPIGKMVTANGFTILMNVAANQIGIFNNTTEQLTGSPVLQGPPFDIAISTDGGTAYAAVRNSGTVEVIDTNSGNVKFNIPVPSATRLVEGPKQHQLLAFADDPQNIPGANANSFFVIDTTANQATAIAEPAGSQPYTAVFDPSDANDTTAFILNCGTECGGTVAPNVVKVNFSDPKNPVFSPSAAGIPVSGATVGLLTGSSLFVAGTPAGSATGTLQVIDTGSLAANAPVAITDGLHSKMAMTSNNRLYIGASHCTIGPVVNSQVAGCLSIFHTDTTAVVIPVEPSLRLNFNVTGFQPISNRNVMYVCQGGELDIFDITADAVSTSINPLDVVGNAVDVVQIDP
jgi:hypothetical protein